MILNAKRHIFIQNVNQDKISAKMKDGVLSMTIRKSKNISEDMKKITIK